MRTLCRYGSVRECAHSTLVRHRRSVQKMYSLYMLDYQYNTIQKARLRTKSTLFF